MEKFVKSVGDLQAGDRTNFYEVLRVVPYRNGVVVFGKTIDDGGAIINIWKDRNQKIKIAQCIDAISE